MSLPAYAQAPFTVPSINVLNGGALSGSYSGNPNFTGTPTVNGVPIGTATGNVVGPGSSTNLYVPQWSGTTGTSLLAGLPVTQSGAASSLVETTSGGVISGPKIASPSLFKNVVTDCGADPTGTTDSAPAFRSCIASNTKVWVPYGTYLFASTQAAPCCAFDNPAVLAQSLSNFEIDGYGATITIANGIALSSAFHFDQDSNFIVRGLTIQGNRTGLTGSQENVGVTISSGVNFRVSDTHFSGNFGGVGAGVAGDWMVNGAFDNLTMDAMGHCFDVAYLKGVSFSTVHAKGADTNGNSGSGQVGQTCFSVIVDPPNAAQNHTGISFTETDGVRVSGLEESNFNTGGYITTGLHYAFSDDYWHDNPGLGGASGLGLWINYDASTSVGVPPGNIRIADRFANNGSAVAGYGVLFGTSGITNSDTISDVTISGSQFDDNNNTGIGANASTGLSGIISIGNTFSGAAQTASFGANFKSAASLFQDTSGATQFGSTVTLVNNKALQSLDASGNAQALIFGTAANETGIRPLANTARIRLQGYTGVDGLDIWSGNGSPFIEANTPITFDSTATLTNNIALQSKDSSGTPQPMLLGDSSNEAVLRPLAANALIRFQNFGGGDIATFASNTGIATFFGQAKLPASTTSAAPLNIPQGTAPTSPNNGDVWTTSAGMYARINGATVGPFGAGGSGWTPPTTGYLITANGTTPGGIAPTASGDCALVNSSVAWAAIPCVELNPYPFTATGTIPSTYNGAITSGAYIPKGTTVSAPISITLPPTSALVPGTEFTVWDESGAITSTNTLTVIANTGGPDHITNGSSTTDPSEVISIGGGYITFKYASAHQWTVTGNRAANSEITDNGAGVVVGSATGGAQGTGTLNATGLFINGVAVGTGGSGTVNSGTANQLAYYAASGTAVSGTSTPNLPSGGAYEINGSKLPTLSAFPIGWAAGQSPNNTILVADLPYAITLSSVVARIETALGSAGTVAVYIAPNGTPCSSGTNVASNTFNANGTAATNQTLTLTTTAVPAGDSVCLQTTGSGWGAGASVMTVTAYGYPS